MSDSAIQTYAREAARSGQFYLGLKGRRVKFVDTLGHENEIAGQILEVNLANYSGSSIFRFYWHFLLLKDNGQIVDIKFDYNYNLYLIG